MKLGIDAVSFGDGGGVTHLIELLKAAEPERFGFSEVAVWGRSTTLDQLPQRPWLRLMREPAVDGGLITRAMWQRTTLAQRVRDEGCDLLFVPGGTYAGRFRPIATMARNLAPFDEAALRLYGFSMQRLKFEIIRRVQTNAFRSASGMIFLSSTARSQITSITGPLSAPTEIIPHGISEQFFSAVRPQKPQDAYSDTSPYRLLYVSRFEPYKHHHTVISAVLKLRRNGVPIALDLVGNGGYSARDVEDQLRAEDPEQAVITNHGVVPHADLPALYSRADAVVFASSCENLPNILLEAMAAGVPIAVSRRGVMPEVVGNAGFYFDPESVSSLSATLRDMLENPARRAEYALAAKERVRGQTWPECARRTFHFLAQVALRR